MKFKAFLFAFFLSPALFASSTVIGIAEASGVGKTTLAKKLQTSLGEDVAVICQDNYYKDLSQPSMTKRAQTNFDTPSSMDICLCRRIERDQKERERSFSDIKNQYLKTVRPMVLKHTAPSKAYADLIILNETENAFVLDFISGQLSHIIIPSLTCQTCPGNSDV